MRIAYLLSYYPAVSHTFFRDEIFGLRQQGIEVETLSINNADEVSAESEPEESARTCYIKSTPKLQVLAVLLSTCMLRPQASFRGLRVAVSVAPNWRYAFFYWIEALLVGERLRVLGVRSLHVHFGGPVATVGLITAEAFDLRYSLTIHGPDEFFDVEKFALRQKFARAEFIFAIGDYCRSQILRLLAPEQWSKVRVVRLGVDTVRFSPQTVTAKQQVVIGCIGRLVPAKAQQLLLESVAELSVVVQVELVGDGPDRSALETAAKHLGISGRVRFHGALSHAATGAVLRGVDVFVLPSFAEGIPVALMEAMALGLPCVSTYVAGIPELIQDGVDGLLVPAANGEALTAAIERLVTDESLRAKLGQAARQKVCRMYDLNRNLLLRAKLLKEFNESNPR
jgi:glycosyltransferase involved in cell wall biosynthesis